MLLILAAAALLALPPNTEAATVALGSMHMAASPGARQRAVSHFPSGVATVYFDYSVLAPYAGDAGTVAVYRGGTHGRPIAQFLLILSLPTALYVTLKSASGTWPDGGYCTVLTLNDRPDSMNGRMPIGWTVGHGTIPASCAQQLHIAMTVRTASAQSTLQFTVTDPQRHPVANAAVRVNGTAAGISRTLHARTGPKGRATFRTLHGLHAGTLTITASHPGYRTVTLTLPVHP